MFFKLFLIFNFIISFYISSQADSNKKYLHDYFSNHIPSWIKNTAHFKNRPGIKCLEVGSFEGRATIFIANNICNGKDSVTYAVDTWKGSDEHDEDTKKVIYDNFFHNTVELRKLGKIIALQGKSENILINLLTKIKDNKLRKFDFIYIDASHWSKDVMVDTVLSWEMLKVGGIMIFDDYNWGDYSHRVPTPAIDGFLLSYNSMYEILENGYQLHVKKIRDSPTMNSSYYSEFELITLPSIKRKISRLLNKLLQFSFF